MMESVNKGMNINNYLEVPGFNFPQNKKYLDFIFYTCLVLTLTGTNNV